VPVPRTAPALCEDAGITCPGVDRCSGTGTPGTGMAGAERRKSDSYGKIRQKKDCSLSHFPMDTSMPSSIVEDLTIMNCIQLIRQKDGPACRAMIPCCSVSCLFTGTPVKDIPGGAGDSREYTTKTPCFSSKQPFLWYFCNNVSNSGFQVTTYKPCPHMLRRYIHHVLNKEHVNPYRFRGHPVVTIPPGLKQTHECRRLFFPALHEHSKHRDTEPVQRTLPIGWFRHQP